MIKQILIGIVLALILSGAIFAFVVLKEISGNSNNDKVEVEWKKLNTNFLKINKSIVGEEQISFLLYKMSADKLKKQPFTGDEPRIEFSVSNVNYCSKVVDGNIFTKLGDCEKPDIKVSIDGKNMIYLLNSNNTKEDIQNFSSEGKIRIEMLASKTTLFSKGYLKLYEEVTGEKIL